MPPDLAAAAVTDALNSVTPRLRARHLLHALTAGALVAGVALNVVAGRLSPSAHLWRIAAAVLGGVVCAVVAAVSFVRLAKARSLAAAANVWEAADPGLMNLGVTALQLAQGSIAASPTTTQRVMALAAVRAGKLNPRRAVPLSRDGLAVLVALVPLLVAAARMSPPAPATSFAAGDTRTRSGASTSAGRLVVVITPPPYTGRGPTTISDPAAIEALAGSTAAMQWTASDGAAILRLNGRILAARHARGITSVEASLTDSGYLAVDDGEVHRVMALTVVPDATPDVRILAPARDLRIADTSRPIAIEARATDDLGLRTINIRYTVVSGAGENFTFKEGVLPVAVSRTSDRAWSARVQLLPSALGLEPGDSLVYRATASDRRPGDAGLASSDTYFIEVAGPGDVALDAVDMPPDRERYALSEQMIVLKIERLRAREAALSRSAVAEEAGNIEAEQRAVRANFIFMLGGEVEDEDVEAQQSTEIQEGRFANRARQDIVSATVLMGRVQTALGGLATQPALALAREAVVALQRAFGHSRYLLRALPSTARIDPSRRLSGDVTSAADWARNATEADSDPPTARARAALGEILAVCGALTSGGVRGVADTLPHLAERIIEVDPSDASVAEAGRSTMSARDALERGRVDAAVTALHAAARALLTRTQRGRIDAAGADAPRSWLAGRTALLDRNWR